MFARRSAVRQSRRIWRRRLQPWNQWKKQPGKSFATESETQKSWFRRPGNSMIALGWTILFICGVDQYLQYNQKLEREALMGRLQDEADERNTPSREGWEHLPVLFSCRVRRVVDLDGSHCLRNVAVGDVVDVLQEGVGPGGVYNLCRTHPVNERGAKMHINTGWYPMGCLEKMDQSSS